MHCFTKKAFHATMRGVVSSIYLAGKFVDPQFCPFSTCLWVRFQYFKIVPWWPMATHTTYLFLSHLGDFGWGIIWSFIVTLGSPNLDLGFSCFFRIAFRYTWPIWTFSAWLVWLAWLHGFWARLLFIGLFFYFYSILFYFILFFLLFLFCFVLFYFIFTVS